MFGRGVSCGIIYGNLKRIFSKFYLPWFLLFFCIIISPLVVQGVSIGDITIDPALEVSYFSSYTIDADVVDYPTNGVVDLTLSGLNGDGGICWRYKVDGTCQSSGLSYTMSYLSGTTWRKTLVRPDNIYPQIFFASSTITWNNEPSNIDLRRNNYHLLHFVNNFSMVADQSFWIELNVAPVSLVNSADLEVYLVKKGKSTSFFNSDWRSSADVELVGTINRNSVFNHTHSVNSGHFLVSLSTNSDGTVGGKNLDISDDFWIILYANSPNTARGWNLRYQNQSLCTTADNWYLGNQSGWTTTIQAGCPDSHIHMARRTDNADGVRAVVTADDETSTQDFSFAVLPNLPPNQSTFISPVVGGTYAGDIGVDWATSTDANGDSLTYDLYLLDSEGVVLSTLVASSSNTTYTLDSTSLDNGVYSLKGYVNDGTNAGVEFSLNSNFNIDNSAPIQSLTNISIASDNDDSNIAKAGDTVTISFTSSGSISAPTVSFYSGGADVTESVTVTNISGNDWLAVYVVSQDDTDGEITFNIGSANLDQDYFTTADNSIVDVDVTSPDTSVASPGAGQYSSAQSVLLSSVGSNTIYYTSDGSNPSCTSGTLYDTAISVAFSKTIKAVSCDLVGNQSEVVSFEYTIVPSRTTRISSGTSIQGRVNNLLSLGLIQSADDLKKQWPSLFPNAISTDASKGSTTTSNIVFTRNLYIGIIGSEVKLLQQYLNTHGFILASTGPGSLGNETTMFGSLTRTALIKFQKANNIIPAIGYFGPITREFLKLQGF